MALVFLSFVVGLKGGELKFSSDGQAEAFRDYVSNFFLFLVPCEVRE